MLPWNVGLSNHSYRKELIAQHEKELQAKRTK